MSIIDTIRNKFNEMFPDENDPKPKDTISVILPNGNIREYEHWNYLHDDECVVCFSFYHWHMDCPVLWDEARLGKAHLIKIKDAKKNGKLACYKCEDYDKEDDE